MTLKIKQAENGYIITLPREQDTPEGQIVIESKDGEEKQAFIDLVNELAEQFGFIYNKWKEDNLKISFDLKGHKLE